jgi:hypothetical protein
MCNYLERLMMRIFLMSICAASAFAASPYEIRLEFEPEDTLAQLALRHPLDIQDMTNRLRLRDCGLFINDPDWGVAESTDDDPRFIGNPAGGGRLIKANYLQDPGDCGVMVYVGSGSATCTVHIVSWPGLPTQSYTRIVNDADGVWWVTNLPCAQDIGLKVLKAKQVRKGLKWGWVKIKATFEDMALMDASNTFFVSSLRDQRWVYYHERRDVRIRKEGMIGRFGTPKRAFVYMEKKNKIIAKGSARNIMQNETIAVFIGLGGWSGYEEIPLDRKGKYIAPKDK